MRILELQVKDFRCLQSVCIQPSEGINLIVGPNASGKTSLLEAIYLLGRGKSFRYGSGAALTRDSAQGFVLHAQLEDAEGRQSKVGVEHVGAESRYRLNGEDAKALELIRSLPVQLIDPGLHRLLEEGPTHRRQYMDWGLFHVEQGFYEQWKQYRRAIRQRNRALRNGEDAAGVAAWDRPVAEAGEAIHQMRKAYLEGITERLRQLLAPIIKAEVGAEYYRGWSQGKTLMQSLRDGVVSDRESGFTRMGPHRADFVVRFKDVKARGYVSRGEQKMISAGLLVAQAAALMDDGRKPPVLLIDDLAAELDAGFREALLKMVAGLGAQCFLSFLSKDQLPTSAGGAKMFHVEHGQIRGPEVGAAA